MHCFDDVVNNIDFRCEVRVVRVCFVPLCVVWTSNPPCRVVLVLFVFNKVLRTIAMIPCVFVSIRLRLVKPGPGFKKLWHIAMLLKAVVGRIIPWDRLPPCNGGIRSPPVRTVIALHRESGAHHSGIGSPPTGAGIPLPVTFLPGGLTRIPPEGRNHIWTPFLVTTSVAHQCPALRDVQVVVAVHVYRSRIPKGK